MYRVDEDAREHVGFCCCSFHVMFAAGFVLWSFMLCAALFFVASLMLYAPLALLVGILSLPLLGAVTHYHQRKTCMLRFFTVFQFLLYIPAILFYFFVMIVAVSMAVVWAMQIHEYEQTLDGHLMNFFGISNPQIEKMKEKCVEGAIGLAVYGLFLWAWGWCITAVNRCADYYAWSDRRAQLSVFSYSNDNYGKFNPDLSESHPLRGV